MTLRTLLLLVVLFAAWAAHIARAQETPAVPGSLAGIQFFEGTFDELRQKAAKTGRPFFVDFYASWCGPCKTMSKYTFTDGQVGAYANANFLAYKLDCEVGEGPGLAKTYAIDAYPTIIFFDAKGNIIYRLVGMADALSFLQLMQKVNPNGAAKTGKGGADPQALVTDQNYLGLKSQYFELYTQTLLTTGSLAPLAQQYAQAQAYGKQKNDFGYEYFRKDLAKAKTLTDLQLKLLDIGYALGANQLDKVIEVADPLFEAEQLPLDLLPYLAWQFRTQDDVPSAAMRWINQAVRTQGNHANLDTKAYLQYLDGKFADAHETAKLALKAAKTEKAEAAGTETLLLLIDARLKAK